VPAMRDILRMVPSQPRRKKERRKTTSPRQKPKRSTRHPNRNKL
jgi:hypothetical protein